MLHKVWSSHLVTRQVLQYTFGKPEYAVTSMSLSTHQNQKQKWLGIWWWYYCDDQCYDGSSSKWIVTSIWWYSANFFKSGKFKINLCQVKFSNLKKKKLYFLPEFIDYVQFVCAIVQLGLDGKDLAETALVWWSNAAIVDCAGSTVSQPPAFCKKIGYRWMLM